MNRAWKKSVWIGSIFILFVAVAATAGLPMAVGGKRLPSLAPMVEKVIPSVVNIATSTTIETPEHPILSDPFFRRFFEFPRQGRQKDKVERSLGSGVVVDARKGFILTNHHVIKDADQITVTSQDGKILSAHLVGVDPETDIAVIRVPAKGLQEIEMGDSDDLRVGDFVVAIGNPFGLGQTVTSGIISALGRTGLGIEGYEDFIQTDASINPGNSGGALVDLDGKLVGINTAILAKGGGNVGIGFAIPVDMAQRVMSQLVEYGEVRRGLLGVQAQSLTPELALAFGIHNDTKGAVITRVTPGTAAERAGLKAGDVITKANGKKIDGVSDLRNLIGLARIGEQVKIEFIRDGRTKRVNAHVAEPEQLRLDGSEVDPRLEGALLEIPDEDGATGISIVDLERESPAWQTGLRPGDRIISANRIPVKTFKELSRAVRKKKHKMLLNIERGGEGFFILVR
ncbi:MAG: Do family serine endopeptidase [Magnetococcales bacterium]|nr:Do family serine endopeptidase [Magnetococcales bacterium]